MLSDLSCFHTNFSSAFVRRINILCFICEVSYGHYLLVSNACDHHCKFTVGLLGYLKFGLLLTVEGRIM